MRLIPDEPAALRRSIDIAARLDPSGSPGDDEALGGDFDFVVRTQDAEVARLALTRAIWVTCGHRGNT